MADADTAVTNGGDDAKLTEIPPAGPAREAALLPDTQEMMRSSVEYVKMQAANGRLINEAFLEQNTKYNSLFARCGDHDERLNIIVKEIEKLQEQAEKYRKLCDLFPGGDPLPYMQKVVDGFPDYDTDKFTTYVAEKIGEVMYEAKQIEASQGDMLARINVLGGVIQEMRGSTPDISFDKILRAAGGEEEFMKYITKLPAFDEAVENCTARIFAEYVEAAKNERNTN